MSRFSHWLKRSWQKLYIKMVRDRASIRRIAAGWAIGMFCGCFFPFGFQLIVSVPLAIITRTSKIGAVIGTFITNHVTIFFIYPVQCYLGCRLIGRPLKYDEISSALSQAMHTEKLSELMQCGMNIIIGFFVGGLLLAVIMTPITYFAVKSLVTKHREKKARLKAATAARKRALNAQNA